MKSFMDGYLTEGCKTCKYWSDEHGCETPLPISECEHFAKMELEEEKAKLKNKKSKYFIYICSCGAIHFIPKRIINSVWNENKEMLLICSSCGKGEVFGAEEHIGDEYEDFENGHDCYEYTFNAWTDDGLNIFSKDKNIITAEVETRQANEKQYHFKNIYYDRGYKPILNEDGNVGVASRYFFGNFTAEGQHKLITKVDMKELIESLGDEKCFALSRRVISGLNWKGTKYED